MTLPRRGDQITVLPFGIAQVEKVLPEGKLQVTINRVLKLKSGRLTNQVVVALHPVWIAEAIERSSLDEDNDSI
jgi:hypothetical protein